MLIFSRMHFKTHILSGAQTAAIGGTHLTVTSNKSVCCICWCVQGL